MKQVTGLLPAVLLLVGADKLAAEPTASGKYTEAPCAIVERKPVLRHAKGLQRVELNAGIAAIGPFLALDWSYYCSPDWQIKLGLGSEWKKQASACYQNLFTQPVLVYTMLSNQRNCYLNMLAGTILVYERYQEQRQHKQQDNFNVGLVLGGELALFITNRLELLLGAAPRLFFLKDPYNRIDYSLSVGIRITC